MVEFGLLRKARIDDPAAGQRPLHQLRQPVIGLWAEDEVDIGRPPADLGALGLGDAAGDGDQHGLAAARFLPLQRADAAKLGEYFFRGLFADVAGVEDDQVGVLGRRRQAKAERRQQLGHARRIIDVHLTAIGRDKHLLGHALPSLCGKPGIVISSAAAAAGSAATARGGGGIGCGLPASAEAMPPAARR